MRAGDTQRQGHSSLAKPVAKKHLQQPVTPTTSPPRAVLGLVDDLFPSSAFLLSDRPWSPSPF